LIYVALTQIIFSQNHSRVRVKHLGKKKEKTEVKEPSNTSFTGSLQTSEHGEYNNAPSPRKKTQEELKMTKPRLIVKREKE